MEAEARANWNLLLHHQFEGRTSQALVYGEQALALTRKHGLNETTAYVVHDLGVAYSNDSQFHLSTARLSEAEALWRELNNLPMLTDTLSNLSYDHMMFGDYDRAIAISSEAENIGRTIGNRWGQCNGRAFVGIVYHDRGQIDTALDHYTRSIQLAEEIGHPVQVIGRIELASLYVTMAAVSPGMELVEKAAALAVKTLPLFRSWALAIRARLQLLAGNLDEARQDVAESREALLKEGNMFIPFYVQLADAETSLVMGESEAAVSTVEALEQDLQDRGVRMLLPDALLLKGKGLFDLGRHEAAGEALGQAREAAEALGARRTMWQIAAALVELATATGDEAAAASHRLEAEEMIGYIVEHTRSSTLKESFLGQEAVRKVLAGT